MKREILFRGQRKNKEWMYGDLLEYNGKTQIIQHHFDSKWSIERNDIVPETVGQYTGLLDKNGVRICEGDLIKNDDCICMVEYVAPEFIRHVVKYDLRNQTYPFKSHHKYEVIGNIHDNPELL